MKLIISAHEGSIHNRKVSGVKGPSSAYMKAWLKVHAEAADADISTVGLYTLNPVDPQRLKGTLQTFNLKCDFLVSNVCFRIQYMYCAATSRRCRTTT